MEKTKKTEVSGEVTVNLKRNKWPWILLGIVVLFVIIGSVSTQPTKVGTNDQGTANNTQEKKIESFKVGDVVKLDDYQIVVNSISAYSSKNGYIKPESGKKWLVVDITQENKGTDSKDYNTFDYKLQDNQDYRYENTYSDKEPSFSSGILQPGAKTRGFITFEIPANNTANKLIFTPSWWTSSQIEIDLK